MFPKNLKIILILLIGISCKEKQEQNSLPNLEKKQVEVVKKDTLLNIQNDDSQELETTNLINTLLTSTYRIDENNDPTSLLNKNWFDLHEENGSYFLEKVNYTLSKSVDECSGMNTKTIETKRNTLLLLDYALLQSGKIENLLISKKNIWPNETMSLDYKNTTYTFRGVGTIKSTSERTNDKEQKEVWHNVENYKLFIKTSNSNEELIISEKNFSDTFVVLIFAGDIDRDGKLDFIFEANRNYEEKRVLLFLSTKADKNKIIKKVSEISIQFDC